MLNRLFLELLHLVERKLHSIEVVKMPFYAVANGRSTGIFQSWSECESQVKGFQGAKYKKFNTRDEALNFVTEGSASAPIASNKMTKLRSASPTISSRPSFSRNFHNGDNGSGFKDDFDDDLMKKMDEIEKRIGTIKNNVFSNKRTPKAIVIDISDRARSLKRPGENVVHSDVKKAKNMSVIKGTQSYDFEIDESGYVKVYTDGACSNNGFKGAQAGLGVYFGEDHPLNVSEPVSGHATNNCGEIQAATKAIRIAHSLGIKKLNIKTDSKFVINSITKWMPGWKRKGWKLANGEPVKNKVDFKDLDEAQQLVTVKWEYVNAHKGIHGNEKADQLAKAGAAKYNR